MDTDLIQKIIDEKRNNPWWIESEKKVVGKYGQIFKPTNLDNLTKEDFKSFLLIKNNLHWEAIHRQGNIITADMKILIKFLKYLLNESIPIKERLSTKFVEDGGLWVKGMGRAVMSPIMMVVYPDKYGVWNTRSEAALKKLNLFPHLRSGDGFGDKYIKINNVLLELASKYQISLWNLDGVLGEISGWGPWLEQASYGKTDEEEEVERDAKEHGIEDVTNFGMERQLEDFLIANWNKTLFGKDYDLIYGEGNDLLSQQYQTATGPIDILAKAKSGKGFLVIELKKGRTSDAVVGQILRYITWIRENLAHNDPVQGAIIILESDEKLRYSLKSLNGISLYTYRVDFKLNIENI
ncbi:MAG: hypothetical protein UV73_C0011G0047 [Candidatus Gottesmanbacteria bacterium GW2011_GWA2_43_14]|uniref:Endonuclease NucS C-terminal domain-containing protein n=1 Tax=Candidatus Gottesmanbacteria bacterium GW2011_GWA2_43_14 TaxID=1618443 RepID=A0A0G1DEP4_9BACT|nr:MAG: hypothetical protein UV73_C0011G0047 [Candidatus Gottesmanbacteria bacterium GW2011_GWA2_43_14]